MGTGRQAHTWQAWQAGTRQAGRISLSISLPARLPAFGRGARRRLGPCQRLPLWHGRALCTYMHVSERQRRGDARCRGLSRQISLSISRLRICGSPCGTAPFHPVASPRRVRRCLVPPQLLLTAVVPLRVARCSCCRAPLSIGLASSAQLISRRYTPSRSAAQRFG
jgi:hypothetical protein